jgi:hypothetical protein
MYIEKTWKGISPVLSTPDLERLIKSKQRPWEDCIQFFSHQEQAFLVQDGFPPSAIMYAWRDHPDWIKDETRAKAVGRTSAMMNPQQHFQPFRPETPPVVVPPPKLDGVRPQTQAPKPDGAVGAWGTASWDNGEGRDAVVPAGIADGVSTSAVDAALASDALPDRQKLAQAALADAVARATKGS